MQRRKSLALSIPYQLDFFKQYKFLSQGKSQHILLESGRGGRYNIVGLNPVAVIRGKDETLHISESGKGTIKRGNPLDLMQEYMEQWKTDYNPEYPPFQGGAIGYFSYDCIRYIEKLPSLAEDDIDIPDIFFLLFDDVFVYDQKEQVLWVITHYVDKYEEAKERLNEWKSLWMTEAPEVTVPFESPEKKSEAVAFTEAGFMKAVECIQEYIGAGDVFQVNLSMRQERTLQTHPLEIYTSLREINPSPYMGYLELGDFQIVSGSPELLIKKQGTEVSTRPIAGTRSRGADEQEDEELARELIENEKERAEHVMLVDLERNDLGRVCKYGTVEVDEFMVIEKYSHVMHIVSNVRGEVEEDKDAFDLVKAVFPGGTITGAPKIRTMEIIEELEPVRRGIYTGSIGWIGYSGDTELNIVIRTLLAKDGKAHVQAGAGIVIDSNPENEYKESLKKAIALWRAKERSEETVR
ncbi:MULTISPECIES: aminodeoxychorismate synthase component I [Bacillus]|uniref:Aminodeoxychorismate synthase component 1 n=1 Tax=Bacillus cereus (strain ATCC 14579 / DSM 31 / CCUG 7414 / JCM 2152 / NBRC 15305 / NCIMB 9373 / NCTC 2599 / NRRL B-3711) TaxID=226900 RepID=Q81J78_BACCR|nr:aminodeoxychorismate synthase component I [Bacillus cereus]AAP07172.1 Para-aminobenzoate synthase component I [Bacillus cereus ATCC 14579]EEL13709.1 Para-aminobenzoate synthase component 1 [Bacillus cereus BDRD-Cer4]ETT88403.1 para-aminobenzoate synthase component I [Bacillus cereus]KZD78094.1 Para-aminobenzoate synthase aminase component [Bacillus cereus]MCC3288968.1 aminodeoxychorismate synthase component I [Bacillus cereus]